LQEYSRLFDDTNSSLDSSHGKLGVNDRGLVSADLNIRFRKVRKAWCREGKLVGTKVNRIKAVEALAVGRCLPIDTRVDVGKRHHRSRNHSTVWVLYRAHHGAAASLG
jgi:hypothetical protein